MKGICHFERKRFLEWNEHFLSKTLVLPSTLCRNNFLLTGKVFPAGIGDFRLPSFTEYSIFTAPAAATQPSHSFHDWPTHNRE